MTNNTAWVGGRGQGLTFGTLINSGDMTSLGTSSGSNYTVLGTPTVANGGTTLDMYMDISAAVTASSSVTPAAGANLAFYIYALNQDGTHYGDNQLVTATQASVTPSFSAAGTIPVPTAASTTYYGTLTGVIIPPGSFKVAITNNSGAAFTAGTQTVSYRTYNINLNA